MNLNGFKSNCDSDGGQYPKTQVQPLESSLCPTLTFRIYWVARVSGGQGRFLDRAFVDEIRILNMGD